MYENGRAVKPIKPNPEKAAEYHRKAADGELAWAQYSLGRLYRDGSGVAANPAKAVNWFRKAGDQENADAQYELGSYYERGEGIGQNRDKPSSGTRRPPPRDRRTPRRPLPAWGSPADLPGRTCKPRTFAV